MPKKHTTKQKTTRAKASPPTFDALPDLCTPEEAGAFLRTSRNTTYTLIHTGALPHVRFGRLIRIRKADLLGAQS